jgi:hypothetical protein
MKFRSLKYALLLAFAAQSGMAFSAQSNIPTEEEVAQEMKVHFAKQDAGMAKWKAEKQGDFSVLSPLVGDTKMIIYEGDADEQSARNKEAYYRLTSVADAACPGLSKQTPVKNGIALGGVMKLESDKNICQFSISRSVQFISVNGEIGGSAANSPVVAVLLLKPKSEIESSVAGLQMTALATRKLMLLTPLLDLNGNKIAPPEKYKAEESNQTTTSLSSPAPTSLKAAMDAIPRANRPIGMSMRKGEWDSFNAITEYINMVLFPGGVAIPATCRDWNPQQSPRANTGCETTSYTLSNGKVRFPGDDEAADLSDFRGFAAGKSVSIKVGNVGGAGIASYGGGINQVSGGELLMTPSGAISSGDWVSNSISGSNFSGYAGSSTKGVTGKYYLDGFLIAVQDANGQISIGFIGQKYEANDVYTYLNGELFWK